MTNIPHLGEWAALCTAFFWTITAMAFESASRKVGSLPVNWIRLGLAFLFLTVFCAIFRGKPLPLDAPSKTWLSLSGLIGFTFGDLCLFQSYVVIGSRIAMLVMATVPPMTSLLGWAVLGETLSSMNVAGMALTLGGVAIVVLERKGNSDSKKFSHSLKGMALAFGGAFGQAVGLILSKLGLASGYSAFSATQIRIFVGLAGFSVLFFFLKTWPKVRTALRHSHAMKRLSLGAFFGPFLGVSFSLLAVQHTKTGIAATIMALVPVMIIAPAAVFFREKVTLREVFGALIAVAGSVLLFL